eukprot:TRINITY_DN894_c1_g1_i4.p1 TRINITY_DN894_c1_g1~~TRINITY_DN894_c1_g1_i4.p1  ORF type:complete len:424 (-),score=20.82 TRINITY_DN894_c1_g1_i4:503-1774(-)
MNVPVIEINDNRVVIKQTSKLFIRRFFIDQLVVIISNLKLPSKIQKGSKNLIIVGYTMIIEPKHENQVQETSSIETEGVPHTTSSSVEFDLDLFRHGKPEVGAVWTMNEQNKDTAKNSGSIALYGKEERFIIHFLGLKFPMEVIKERNQIPQHVLGPVYLCYMFGFGSQLFVFSFGTQLDPISSILSVVVTILGLIAVTIVLQKSIINGIKFTKIELVFIFFGLNLFAALILHVFLKKMPFSSTAYFLIAFYFSALLQLVCIAIATTFNTDDFNDPNYLLKFYYKRFMMAILNVTGTIDALSDIALGTRIFQNYDGFLKFLGLFLFILCSIDFLIVHVRIIDPSKVTISMHVLAVVLEIFVIMISSLAAVKMSKEQLSAEFISLLVVSFFTTGVNFLHHLFVIVEWYLERRQRNRTIHLSNDQ